MKKLTKVIIALVLVIILFFKADPFHFLMPDEVQMILLCIMAAAFALYAGLIFREKPADEREAFHLHRASRIAYIAGTLALTVAIIIQDVFHQLDPVLLAVLGIMIVTKLSSRGVPAQQTVQKSGFASGLTLGLSAGRAGGDSHTSCHQRQNTGNLPGLQPGK